MIPKHSADCIAEKSGLNSWAFDYKHLLLLHVNCTSIHGGVIASITEMGKLRLAEISHLAQGHRVNPQPSSSLPEVCNVVTGSSNVSSLGPRWMSSHVAVNLSCQDECVSGVGMADGTERRVGDSDGFCLTPGSQVVARAGDRGGASSLTLELELE